MFARGASRTILAVVVALPTLFTGATEAGADTAHASSDHPHWNQKLLYYNHVYGVLDRETADAIEHSGYLREFANFDLRTTTGAGGHTWTGRYLLGRKTYLELFGAGDLPGKESKRGAAGLGLSTENTGELTTVLDRLDEQGITEPVEFTQTRDFGEGEPVPWFDSVFTTGKYDMFGAWAMEYRTEYFADPRSNTEPPRHPGDVGRERYMPDKYRQHLMRDITGIHLAVTKRDLANTVPLLHAGGFRVVEEPNGVVAYSGGTTMRFETTTRNQVGLRRIEMSLNRPLVVPRETRIGRSTLVAGPGAQAVWTFPR